MKKISCNIIADLLPLYIDEICNDDTKKLVDEHLEGCKECQKKLQQMSGEIPTESEVPTPEEKTIKKGIRKMKMFKFALIGIVILSILTVFVVVPVTNSIRREGITYSNLKDVYAANAFFSALEKQNYKKAFSYLDTSELSQNDEATYQKFVDGMEKFNETGKEWKKHICISIVFISADAYEIDMRCTMEDGSYIIISMNVTDGKISPYMSNVISENDKLEELWEEFGNFVYTDEELLNLQ